MCVHVYMCARTRARVYMKRMKRANSCVYVCVCVGVSVRVILEILYWLESTLSIHTTYFIIELYAGGRVVGDPLF